MTELWLLLVSALLVVICGAFVAAEFALLAVNRSAVERQAKAGDGVAGGVLHALRTLSTQLSSVQIGITITSLTIGYLAEPSLSALLDPVLLRAGLPEATAGGIAAVAGIAIATMLTMVYGELVPKYIALVRPMATARLLQRPLRMFTKIALPLIRVLNGSANYILRRRGIEPREELTAARSADEILSLVRRSAEKGTLSRNTALMLERSLNFRELTALDIMTPRVRVQVVEVSDTLTTLMKMSSQTGFSRFPVYQGSLDNIVGIARIKHAVKVPEDKWQTTSIDKIMTKPTFVPSTVELGPLLNTLKKDSRHITVVVDEFGGVDGIITIEDLLEELVGEVYDEHDSLRNNLAIVKLRSNAWELSGLLRPDEIAQETGITLAEEDDVETVAGLFLHEFGNLPKKGDIVRIRGIHRKGYPVHARLKVIKMDKRRIDIIEMTTRKVRVESEEDE